MELRDKEFDKLFSAKLEDLEIEPSKAVWQGINEELGGGKRRRLIPFLSVAASIIVLIAAGAWFITHKAEIVKPVKNRMVVNHPRVTRATITKQQVAELPKVIPVATIQVAVVHHTQKVNSVTAPQQAVGTSLTKQQPAITVNQPVIAAIAQKQPSVIHHDSLAIQTVIAAVPLATHQPDKTVATATIVPTDGKLATTPPVKKHKLRSFGDVLNVVIAAVDKRKDKVIQFTNTDDDEATITGVNLGFIKVEKEN